MKRLRLHVPIVFEDWFPVEVYVTPGMTSAELSRRLGVFPPSGLYKWPSKTPLEPKEKIYDVIFKEHQRVYILSRQNF